MTVRIREIVERDRAAWVRMRDALWPGSRWDHEVETKKYFETRGDRPIIFVAETDAGLIGFLELDFRKYAPDCLSSPVPFIEGWYVEPAWQRRGVGGALVAAAEARAIEMGHTEIASDVELDNAGSIAAHLALGYEEVERTVAFRRVLCAMTDNR